MALGQFGQIKEVNILKVGIDGLEAISRGRVRIDANRVPSTNQMTGDYMELGFDGV